VEASTGQITLKLTSTHPHAACPVCQQLSQRVHSHYERTLRDLNWAECALTLAVTVRKLFCDNQGCQRRIFSERLPQLTAPWARRTNRMTQQIQDTGVALGGAAGAKLLQKQGYSFL
ncbi:MAG: transposase family protein, partial [Microcystaceae cyanobacterium]